MKKSTLKIDTAGDWKLYATILPAGSEAVGVVTVDGYSTGALVRLANGRYAQVNSNTVKMIDGRSVAAQFRVSGPAKKLTGGGRVTVYLDNETVRKAGRIGDGNVSEGIRTSVAEKASRDFGEGNGGQDFHDD